MLTLCEAHESLVAIRTAVEQLGKFAVGTPSEPLILPGMMELPAAATNICSLFQAAAVALDGVDNRWQELFNK